MRTAKEIMSDRLLLLYAVACGNRYGRMDGPFKLMKIPFLAELKSTSDGVNSFSYRFYRYTYGPMTTEIYDDGDALHSLGLMTDKRGLIKLTNKGKHLLDSASELFKQNASVCAYVETMAKKYASASFGDLKKDVYAKHVSVEGKKTTIADAPTCSIVLNKLDAPKNQFQLDDDWIDSLWGVFHYTDEEEAMANDFRQVEAAVIG